MMGGYCITLDRQPIDANLYSGCRLVYPIGDDISIVAEVAKEHDYHENYNSALKKLMAYIGDDFNIDNVSPMAYRVT